MERDSSVLVAHHPRRTKRVRWTGSPEHGYAAEHVACSDALGFADWGRSRDNGRRSGHRVANFGMHRGTIHDDRNDWFPWKRDALQIPERGARLLRHERARAQKPLMAGAKPMSSNGDLGCELPSMCTATGDPLRRRTP